MSPGTESEKETSMGTRSERQPSAEERAAAEIVKLLEFHDLGEREAYCALIQAGEQVLVLSDRQVSGDFEDL